jgi:hypothetical protein
MNYRTLTKSALLALTALAGTQVRAVDTDTMASFSIDTSSEVLTLLPHWNIRPNLSGFHFMAQDMGLTGGAPNQFYSLEGSVLPASNITAFTFYVPTGFGTDHVDISTKLANNGPADTTYSGLTSADPDLGTDYGSVRLYTIHHTLAGDQLTVIKTGAATASFVGDPKPMSGPGGTGTGYFGLTFSADNLGSGANVFYYLRTDPSNQHIQFGSLAPGLASAPADLHDLGINGATALAYTSDSITTRYGVQQMYFLRLDPITGFTILSTLNPVSGKASDMANLGSVYSTLTYVPGDVGYGSGQFYMTGTLETTWQSISFAAIDNQPIGASFAVNPTASSALPVTLTVVPGSIGAASISDPVGGVFTVTPTAPGLITLQATQVGSSAPAYEYNMLRQSFTITGVSTLAIDTQPTSQVAATGGSATFSVSASGTSTVGYQWRKAGVAIDGGVNASALSDTLMLANVQVADQAAYDVQVTNLSGTIVSNAVTLTVTSTSAPIIINSPLNEGGTIGAAFSFTINAAGSPTAYTASPLPAGLSLDTSTGVISGTPTTAGTTQVSLGATNGTDTGNSTVTITIAAANTAPVIVNDPLVAGGTTGTAFSFTIKASGSPTAYSASPLPAGLTVDTVTGIISGTPSSVGTTTVTLGATNLTGSSNAATLTIKIATVGVAPAIVNDSSVTAGGTAGTAFNFTVVAAGSPTSYTASPLPAGLSISVTTGAITGTPTSAGSTVVTIGATNASGTTTSTVTIDIVAAPGDAPIITNAASAGGIVGTPFSFAIIASGSPTSYDAPGLPAGLSINTVSGVISGTPSATATVTVMISATNDFGTAEASLAITVISATVHVPVRGPVGVIDLTNGAGAPPSGTVYAVAGLPKGLVLDPATGLVTGTASKPGTYTVTYRTVTTVNGVKTYGPRMTLVIVIDPLSADLSGGFEAILETLPLPGTPVGKVELLVNAKTGAFTGRLINSKAYPFSGLLSLDSTYNVGTASVIIKRESGLNPYRLDVTVDATQPDTNVFAVTLMQLDATNAVVSTLGQSESGVKLAIYTTATPTPWQGKYTLVLEESANLGGSPSPEGSGYGIITIAPARGFMVVKGKLGDGRVLSASLAPSADGSYRWYVSPYSTGGYFGGWIQFVPVAGIVAPYQVAGSGNSELYWEKSPYANDNSYRAGFGPVALIANAQRWTAPANGTPLSTSLNLGSSLIASSLTSASLPSADLPLLPTSLALSDKNKFVVTAPASNSSNFSVKARTFNGTFTLADGLFIGNLTLQDGRKVSVSGALLQQPVVGSGTTIGGGFFVIPPATAGAETVYGNVQFLAP